MDIYIYIYYVSTNEYSSENNYINLFKYCCLRYAQQILDNIRIYVIIDVDKPIFIARMTCSFLAFGKEINVDGRTEF